MDNIDISVLIGKTLTSVTKANDDSSITFVTDSGEVYTMLHFQDCCEQVYVKDICGDLSDLIGTPIIEASKQSTGDCHSSETRYDEGSYTWTFYRLRTMKGGVVISWYGSSNGYYSEDVAFVHSNAQVN